MVGSSSQVEIRVEALNRTRFTRTFATGVIVVGRDASCDLALEDRSVSRQHCEIRIEARGATVTDLHSRNGSYLGSRRLTPGEAVPWPQEVQLIVGSFELYLSVRADAQPKRARPSKPARTVICSDASPPEITLGEKPILLGRDPSCDMVLADQRVSRQQCQIQLRDDQLWVTDLSGRGSTRIGNMALSNGAPQLWPDVELLYVGPFSVSQIAQGLARVAPAEGRPAAVETADPPVPAPIPYVSPPPESTTKPPPSRPKTPALESQMLQAWLRQLPWLFIVILLGGACVLLGTGIGVARLMGLGSSPKPTETAAMSPTPSVVPTLPGVETTATATPLPLLTATPIPTGLSGTDFLPPTAMPLPTVECTPQMAGWLDLPFPYDGKNKGFGNAEQFRQASQRTASQGRIYSFFDHQYPLYSREAQQSQGRVNDTMVLFDGSLSLDHDSHGTGDYYSGHSGIDFSTIERRKPTTPVLAPADGTLMSATNRGPRGNFVELLHKREEADFQTIFFHLEPDEHFERMRNLEPGTDVKAGERIGTMGNTGNSTGHHLHFEVRRDCDGDGRFVQDESVDPFGFLVSPEFPLDPLADLMCGGGEYLWKYTLEPTEDGGICAQPERRWQLDPAPFQGFVSLSTFIFTTADPSRPTQVRIWLSDSDAEKVDLQSVKLHRYDTQINNWLVVEGSRLLFSSGMPFVEADLNQNGKYSVTGRPVADIIAPTTLIKLTGPQTDGEFVGAVTVEFVGEDDSPEGVREIQYSLDCGKNWRTYGELAFSVTADDLVECGGIEEGQEASFLILASAVDWADNWEDPPNRRSLRLTASGN